MSEAFFLSTEATYECQGLLNSRCFLCQGPHAAAGLLGGGKSSDLSGFLGGSSKRARSGIGQQWPVFPLDGACGLPLLRVPSTSPRATVSQCT